MKQYLMMGTAALALAALTASPAFAHDRCKTGRSHASTVRRVQHRPVVVRHVPARTVVHRVPARSVVHTVPARAVVVKQARRGDCDTRRGRAVRRGWDTRDTYRRASAPRVVHVSPSQTLVREWRSDDRPARVVYVNGSRARNCR